MVAGLLLAAGMSHRMGSPKMLLPWQGRPLVLHMAQVALAVPLRPLIVVTGFAREGVDAALAGLPLELVHNPDFSQGQSTSLLAGVRALGPEADAVAVLLVDQPLLTAEIVAGLVAVWQAHPTAIVAPTFAGRRGNPVIFPRALWPELLKVTGDRGARALLEARPDRVWLVPINSSAVVDDVDTPDDYQALHGVDAQREPL